MNKYLRGFIAGSMVGIAAGMFFKPQKDGDMKRKFFDSGKNIMGSASQMMSDMITDMKENK
jgi:gas vesicle protein